MSEEAGLANEPDDRQQRPLVTFAVFAYNQEKFIEEAVLGAFNQTYEPLEIILSDDCSSDSTFDLMRSLADTYVGPHQIKLNRNTSNLGVGAHVNKIMSMIEGELIVVAAGDDISLPERTGRLVDLWLKGGRKAHSLYSAAMVVDVQGREMRIMDSPPPLSTPAAAIQSYLEGVQGCTHAWTRDVFSVFGPILPDTVCEDRVIPLRSMMLGDITYSPDILVRYRVHGSNISHHSSLTPDQVMARAYMLHARNLNIAENYMRDLVFAATCACTASVPWLADATKSARSLRDRQADKVNFHGGGHWRKACLIGKYLFVDPWQALKFAVQWVNPGLYESNQKKNFGVT